MSERMSHTLLADRVIMITGAGRGIGAAIAQHAAAYGATVLVCDIDIDSAEETAENIRSSGGHAHAHRLDVTDEANAEEIVTQAIEEFGSIDGLVNNAGRFAMASMEESTIGMWQEMLAANVLGTAICGQAVARRMVLRGSGSIVNMTSGAQCGMAAQSVYSATKGAVASLTYTWALELGPRGVRVNAVSPMAATRMMDVNHDFRAQHPEMGTLPPGPPAASNAPVVTYLLSDLSSALNGQVVRVTGGDLGLMTHPSVLAPIMHREEWSVEQVAETFDQVLVKHLLPAGIFGLQPARLLEPEADGWRVSADEAAILG